jgi:hypothetical protein
MKKALLLSIFALFAAPVAAADQSHCDATPFTLGKPAPKPAAPAKTEIAQANEKSAPAPAATVPKKADAKPKAKIFTPCKDSKTKKPA